MADVPLNERKAAKALAFFNRLRLPDVPGQPYLRDACGDWFKDILCAFVASEDPETRQRLVWEALCLVPKKNSKTTYGAAGLGLTCLYMCDTPNGSMLLIGPTHTISERGFSQAEGMIRADPKLQKIFKVQNHLKTITRVKTNTTLSVKTFDTSIVTGEIPLLTIVDELHELGKKAVAPSVMQQIRGGGITQQGGQVFFITTQSDKPPTGIWKTELKKARDIRDGVGGPNPIMLPILYEYPEALQKNQRFWRDPKNWPLVLPNIGRSIDRQKLENDYDNNGSDSKEAEQIWVSQHLNIQIGLGMHNDRWRGADYWERRGDRAITLDEILATSEVCVAGVDGGGLDDLFGLAVIGRHAETKRWQIWAHAWAQSDVLGEAEDGENEGIKSTVLTRRKGIVSKLHELIDLGQLTLCEHPTQDIEEIADTIKRIDDAGLLPAKLAIGLDPAGISALLDELEDRGIRPEQQEPVPQGYKLANAMWGLERKLKDGTAVHGGQELMAWSIENAKTEQRGNAVIITKQTSGKAKIDPLIAVFNAFQLMSRNPSAAPSGSYMDTQEVVVL